MTRAQERVSARHGYYGGFATVHDPGIERQDFLARIGMLLVAERRNPLLLKANILRLSRANVSRILRFTLDQKDFLQRDIAAKQ